MTRFALAPCLALLAVACGDDVHNEPTTDAASSSTGAGAAGPGGTGSGATGDVGASGGVGGVGGVGAAGGDGGSGGFVPSCSEPNGTLLAVSKIYWGDQLPNGMTSGTAWKQYGMNLDGLVSNESSTDLCQPYAGGNPSAVYPDGNDGIDNTFGKNILPMFIAVIGTLSEKSNAAILAGEFTIMIKLEGLGAGDGPTPTKLFAGAPLGASPKFDGTDCWPVASESLADATDIESATVSFPGAAVAQNVWSSNGEATVTVVLSLSGTAMELPVHHARLSAVLDPDHAGATLGLLGGVLKREEFVDALKDFAGALSPDLCQGPTIESLVNQFRQASDILEDATQDPAKECDALSIGLGFDLEAVDLGGIAPPQPPPVDPCP